MHGQYSDSHAGDCDGNPFPARERFAEEYSAHENAEQRADKIAETGSQDVILVYRPDVDQPVGGDQAGTGEHGQTQFAILQRGGQTADIFAEIENDDEQRHRPDDSMANDFQRIDALQQLEIDRHQAPEDTGDQRLNQADCTGGAQIEHGQRLGGAPPPGNQEILQEILLPGKAVRRIR